MKENGGFWDRHRLGKEQSGGKEGCEEAKDGEEMRDIGRGRQRERTSKGGGEKERSGK